MIGERIGGGPWLTIFLPRINMKGDHGIYFQRCVSKFINNAHIIIVTINMKVLITVSIDGLTKRSWDEYKQKHPEISLSALTDGWMKQYMRERP